MRFEAENLSGENLAVILRSLGYRPHPGGSFIRLLSSSGYPRFHLYKLEDKEDRIIFSLHLDQKRPSYKGTPAHSGEYTGEIVRKEALRIKARFGIRIT